MTLKEAIKARHSVRQYKDEPIRAETAAELNRLIAESNAESGLHMQLILDDPACFHTLLAHYGKFRNANNYIALVGSKSLPDLEERSGYYGQKLVLAAQTMGLNTCWVGGTFGRRKCRAVPDPGEKLVCVISVGYGVNNGTERRSKKMEELCPVPAAEMPAWFKDGVEAAMLAPTALNQQRFSISLKDGKAVITAGKGVMTKIDLGIVKCNFEIGSGERL